MRIFRATIHDHLFEIRHGDFGRESVIVDGREISHKPLNGWFSRPHFFTINDEQGSPRNIEVRVEAHQLGFKYSVLILVDGVERTRITHLETSQPRHLCPNCAYDLKGLEPINGEVQCPECGRHANAKLIK